AASTAYVPGGPIPRGTVNDSVPFPTPSRAHGSHHWAFERLLSASLVPLTVTAFATSASPYAVLDGVLGVALVMHSHIGFDSVLEDYLHKRKFPVIGPISTWILRFATVGALVGVYEFNTNDVGMTELVKRVWHA
ncbi:SDHD, membrane anchor subunit of succinate dehydrogenase, partial [Exidia glandulosa HHB12029]